MGLDISYEDGQTPLDEDEKDSLIPYIISTRGELDELEQRNIEEAIRWTINRRKRFTLDEILSEEFVKELHPKMFGGVWKWAGSFRNSNKNLGVDKFQIGVELRQLLDDCRYWIENETFSPDEAAIRFKHRIVSIHCFANGNGRHSRLIADIIIQKFFGGNEFTWGELVRRTDNRKEYITALRNADKGDYHLLIAFARS